MKMNYEPEVDDYVIWERECWAGIQRDEGWVYFKADPIEHKKGFSKHERYITIETSVKDKPKEYEPDLPHVNGKHRLRHPKHEKIHTLLLCYESQWSQLKFVKKRESKVIQHYSQYDDIAGIDNQDRLAGMYKAQEGRYIDIQ